METTQHCPPALLDSIGALRESLAAGGTDPTALARGAEAAQIVGALTEDADLACALVLKPALGSAERAEPPAPLVRLAGHGAASTAAALARFAEIGLPQHWSPEQGLDARQAETLRKMLLAVVSDPRLILARLAEQLVALRHARTLAAEARRRLALETRVIFAPLANRLGIWQLKWELEDLAFRYLEPAAYRHIAAELSERRRDRETYIEAFCAALRSALSQGGIAAQVYGRPKHMYSIHRKMQRKHLAFEQLFDVRAVRIIVESIPDCYAALGVVHGLWRYIPGEFDDYIATPKGNFYRSIHTAVIGPQGKSVEVQIRTRQMHEHAELGVAAHWTYKEGGAADLHYQRKIEAVRRLLEPIAPEGGEPEREFLEQVSTELFQDRVYALTPKGEVVDLPHGATPLDFAYTVHTSLGHRCRGAKVNGRIVPLTHSLENGEIVEIITAKQDNPSRDWLAPELGYLASARNRAKVRAWFRKLDAADNRGAGRTIAERELTRLDIAPGQLPELIAALNARDTEHFHQLLGEGAITSAQLERAAERLAGRAESPAVPVVRSPRRPARSASPVDIEGVGDLPVTLARCCAPLRPQPIVGYVTVGRGVTIHRRGCPSFVRMRHVRPERVLQVEWSSSEPAELPVQIAVHAYDRRGLVRDLSDVLAFERLSIRQMTTTTDRASGTADVLVTAEVGDEAQLQRLQLRLGTVANVISVQRVG